MVCLRKSTGLIVLDVTTIRLLHLFQLALGACLRRFLLAQQRCKPTDLFFFLFRRRWWRRIFMEATLPVSVTGSPYLVRVRTLTQVFMMTGTDCAPFFVTSHGSSSCVPTGGHS